MFCSNSEQDAFYQSIYKFTNASLDGNDLPFNASLTSDYKLLVWDDNAVVDEIMATFTFTPENFYKQDNAETFSINETKDGIDIRISGSMVY